jgi:hypothetical protein
MIRRPVWIASVFVAVARLLPAQVPASERIPVTDPDRLQELGFPRDSRNVFVRAGVWPAANGAREKTVESWGNQEGYDTHFGYELQSYYENLEAIYRTLLDTFVFSSPGGDPAHGHVRVQAPEGAILAQLRFWVVDGSSPDDIVFRVYETCQAPGAEDPIYTLLGEGQSVGNSGSFYGAESLGGVTVDNQNCGYSVQIDLPINGVSTVTLRKFQIVWYRQVSPPPAEATFTDVPTGHPFFQFVEALARSGITVGCGGSSFCPDEPLTRGQMAVFLSKALGLQWPLPPSP